MKGVTFGDANAGTVQPSYAVAGHGSVTLDSITGLSTISVLEGSHQLQTVVNLANDVLVTLLPGTQLDFNNALNLNGMTLTKNGDGTLNINNALHMGSGSILVSSGALGGSGTVGGDLTNNWGILAPGSSSLSATIAGDYDVGPTHDVPEPASPRILAVALAVMALLARRGSLPKTSCCPHRNRETGNRRGGKFAYAILTGVWLSALISVVRAQGLSRGHKILLDNGLQLQALAFPELTGYFDTDRWAESNFTTVKLAGGEYPAALMPPAPGIPWSHSNNQRPYIYPYLPSSAYPYQSSVISMQLSDEQLVGPASNPDVQIELDRLKTAVEVIHNLNPKTIVFTNNQPQTTAELQHYMQFVQPDMIHTGGFPFRGINSPPGGSPTDLYESWEQYRKLGVAGNDGTGTQPIPIGAYLQSFVWFGYTVSESEIQLNRFAAGAFGMKFTIDYIYETGRDPVLEVPIMFSGSGTDNPTPQFSHIAETNRQSRNLGSALVRLVSTDLRMDMGRHKTSVPVDNDLPSGVSAWDSAADPYVTNITATNLGSKNAGLEGDVIVGYFKPLDASFTNPGFEDDIYFMPVNGLTFGDASGAETAQQIRLDFDFAASGINSLQRLSRDTGLVEDVALISDGGSVYHLDLTLDGGTGDLFKFDNGGTFVSLPTYRWAADASGDWNVSNNWPSGAIPNSSDKTAIFGAAITSSQAVFANSAVTAKGVTFDNANSYAIVGAGSVNLEADAGNASITVVQGGHQFQTVVNLNSATDVDVSTGAALAFNNALNLNGNNLTKTGSGTLDINNALNTGGGVVSAAAGVVSGSGTLLGNLQNTGATLAPGNSPGQFTILGDYTHGAGATLAIEIAGLTQGTDYDLLTVGGDITFEGGELLVQLLDEFDPSEGDVFDILNSSSIGGVGFDSLSLPALAEGLAWDTSALLTAGTLSITAAPEPDLVVYFGIGLLGLAAFTRRNIGF